MPQMQSGGAVIGKKLTRHAIDPIRLSVVSIVTKFILNKEKNRETAGHRKCKSGDINERSQLVVDQGPQGNFQVVSDHGQGFNYLELINSDKVTCVQQIVQ